MQKQMIPDPIHTLLHMVNGLSNEKVTQNFRNKKIRETYPKKKKKYSSRQKVSEGHFA